MYCTFFNKEQKLLRYTRQKNKKPSASIKRRKDYPTAVPLSFRKTPALEFCNGNSRQNLLTFSFGAHRRVQSLSGYLTPPGNSLILKSTSTTSVHSISHIGISYSLPQKKSNHFFATIYLFSYSAITASIRSFTISAISGDFIDLYSS